MGSPRGAVGARLASRSGLCQDAKVITDVIALDPGLATGCAHVRSEHGTLHVVSTAELAPRETAVWTRDAIRRAYPDTTAVVIERFIINARTARNSQAPWSLEVIGQTRLIVWEELGTDREPVLQNIADSMAAFTNDRLRRYGLWHKGGKGHAVEALRHAALFLQNNRMLPPLGG